MADNSLKNFNPIKNIYNLLDIFIIVGLAIVPLFLQFNYKINIYLSWEGAYRLYLGQVPYRDFGLPLGFGYWIIPTVFFHLFGPYLISLVKAQVFINIISGLAFRSILRSFDINPGLRTLSILLYCISFSFNNFWPWYNHTVIVYQFIGLAFLLRFMKTDKPHAFHWKLILAGFFLFLSFFTKQDAGGLGILLGLGLCLFYSWSRRNYTYVSFLLVYIVLTGLLFFLPFSHQGIGYWFNHGQAPHSSRLSLIDFLDGFLSGSFWIKFYLLIIALIVWKYYLDFINPKPLIRENFWSCLYLIFTVGVLLEAAAFQVSSYVPVDNNIYFHSFAFPFIFSMVPLSIAYEKRPVFISMALFILFWWSQIFWQYMNGVKSFLSRNQPKVADSVITINTYKIPAKDSTYVPVGNWISSSLVSFHKIKMPPGCVHGIERIMAMPITQKKDLKFLNMSELTPLEYELKAKLETGKRIPLWYHRGVGMFSSQTNEYCKKIHDQYYDLVLYEYIPDLNNFYPFKIQDTLQKYYNRVDRFTAPRNPSNQDFIEVYVKKNSTNSISPINPSPL